MEAGFNLFEQKGWYECQKKNNIVIGLLLFNTFCLFGENECAVACPSNLIPCEEEKLSWYQKEGSHTLLAEVFQRYTGNQAKANTLE